MLFLRVYPPTNAPPNANKRRLGGLPGYANYSKPRSASEPDGCVKHEASDGRATSEDQKAACVMNGMSSHPDVLDDAVSEHWACGTTMTTCVHWFDSDTTAFWAGCARCRDAVSWLAAVQPSTAVDLRTPDDPLGDQPFTAMGALFHLLSLDGAL